MYIFLCRPESGNRSFTIFYFYRVSAHIVNPNIKTKSVTKEVPNVTESVMKEVSNVGDVKETKRRRYTPSLSIGSFLSELRDESVHETTAKEPPQNQSDLMEYDVPTKRTRKRKHKRKKSAAPDESNNEPDQVATSTPHFDSPVRTYLHFALQYIIMMIINELARCIAYCRTVPT